MTGVSTEQNNRTTEKIGQLKLKTKSKVEDVMIIRDNIKTTRWGNILCQGSVEGHRRYLLMLDAIHSKPCDNLNSQISQYFEVFLNSTTHDHNCLTYPSPLIAQQDCMCHPWVFRAVSLSDCEISLAVIQPSMSCLFAYTNTCALYKSYKTQSNSDYSQWEISKGTNVVSEHSVELFFSYG